MDKLGCKHASQFIWDRLHGNTEAKKKKKDPESATNGGA
jgi:hypothetical protein